jgi:hypothetical protein
MELDTSDFTPNKVVLSRESGHTIVWAKRYWLTLNSYDKIIISDPFICTSFCC